MGTYFKDLAGQRFGRLVAIRKNTLCTKGKNKVLATKWLCRCDCGIEKWVLYNGLSTGAVKSCGCLRKELVYDSLSKGEEAILRKYKQEYCTWQSMKTRCYNAKNPGYKNYGGRGITVCDRWLESFSNFIEDMGKKPKSEGFRYSIERLNNDEGYSPENCIWASCEQQMRNRRCVKFYTWKGLEMTITEICRKENVNYISTYQEVRNGKSIEEAVSIIRGRANPFRERNQKFLKGPKKR